MMLISLLTHKLTCKSSWTTSLVHVAFGLTISLKKTKVMFTPAPGEPYIEPNIMVNGTRLKVVDTFVYLGFFFLISCSVYMYTIIYEYHSYQIPKSRHSLLNSHTFLSDDIKNKKE